MTSWPFTQKILQTPFVQHMANLLPVFDRNTGTSHLDFIFPNRSGASLTFAPLNSQGRSRNAHLNMFDPPGICSQAVFTA